MTQKNHKTKIIGAIMLCVNVFLLYLSAFMLFNWADLLLFIYLPNLDWIIFLLLVWFLLTIIGIVVAICLLKNKISILKAVLLQLLIIVLTIVTSFLPIF